MGAIPFHHCPLWSLYVTEVNLDKGLRTVTSQNHTLQLLMEAKAAQRSLSLSETKSTVFSWRFGAETRHKKTQRRKFFTRKYSNTENSIRHVVSVDARALLLFIPWCHNWLTALCLLLLLSWPLLSWRAIPQLKTFDLCGHRFRFLAFQTNKVVFTRTLCLLSNG